MRGQNRQIIFEDDEDREKFIETLNNVKIKSGCSVYAYCLMGNHIHLLMREKNEEMGIVMRRMGASYVYWYNWKYKRCGHLFQDRYISEAVEDDKYFLTVLRYIHQNPVKAGIVKDIGKYKWSSYSDYIEGHEITDIDYALEIIDSNRERAIGTFKSFNEEDSSDICLEMNDNIRMRDEEAVEIIKNVCKIQRGPELQNIEKEKRDGLIGKLKTTGLSTRQIERLTGISRGIILKA